MANTGIRKHIFEDKSGSMYVRQDKIHKYLGMTMDCTVIEIEIIIMMDYIDEILTALKKMYPSNGGTKFSAALENLFKVDRDCENLRPEKSKGSHNIVDKTL